MATALDLISRALRRLRVLGIGKEPKAAEATDCLAILNGMLAEWAIDGIDLAMIDLVTTDNVNLPADHIETITLSLAERCGGMFGAELSPQDTLAAERGRLALRAYHFSIADLRDDNPLSRNNLSQDD